MAIVIVQAGDARLLVLFNEGECLLPKGRLEKNESIIHAAIREVREEAGVEIRDEDHIGHVASFGFDFRGVYKRIEVELFTLTEVQKISVNLSEGFTAGEWMLADDAMAALTHEDARNALATALRLLEGGATRAN